MQPQTDAQEQQFLHSFKHINDECPWAWQSEDGIPAGIQSRSFSLLPGAIVELTVVRGAEQTPFRCTYKDAEQDQVPWEIPPASKETGADQRDAIRCAM